MVSCMEYSEPRIITGRGGQTKNKEKEMGGKCFISLNQMPAHKFKYVGPHARGYSEPVFIFYFCVLINSMSSKLSNDHL